MSITKCQTQSNLKYPNIVIFYDFCDWSAADAVGEYHQFDNRDNNKNMYWIKLRRGWKYSATSNRRWNKEFVLN